MKYDFDLKNFSVIFVTLFIFVLMGYLFCSTINMGNNVSERKTVEIEKIIDKALVHCYALEGSYPADVHELSKYGVIFDDEKYIYYYDIYGANVQPEVTVMAKE